MGTQRSKAAGWERESRWSKASSGSAGLLWREEVQEGVRWAESRQGCWDGRRGRDPARALPSHRPENGLRAFTQALVLADPHLSGRLSLDTQAGPGVLGVSSSSLGTASCLELGAS